MDIGRSIGCSGDGTFRRFGGEVTGRELGSGERHRGFYLSGF